MTIDFDKVCKLNINVSSYNFRFNRYLGSMNPERNLTVDQCLNLVFNDTKELDELLYTLIELKKRLEVERGHFIDYEGLINKPIFKSEVL